MNVFFTLIKRELLEHNSLWRVPIILLVLAILIRLSLVFGNYATDINIPDQLQLNDTIDAWVDSALASSLGWVNSIIVWTMFVVAVFYALNCLFTERQDQSVLFWRSLPVSDALTVASKLTVAVVIVPLLIIVCQIISAFIFLGAGSFEFLINVFGETLLSIFKLVLWSLLPTAAWCMFCSEFCKRNPFLLAIFIPLGLVLVDNLFFDGSVGNMLVINRVFGFSDYSIWPLLSGVLLSGVFLYMATIKRKQRI